MSALYTLSTQSLDLIYSSVTETDSSRWCRISATSLVMPSAIWVFCCSDLPGHNLTMTCGICSSPCLCLGLARDNLDCRRAGVCTNHWFQIGAALVLCPVGVVDTIIDRAPGRLERDMLRDSGSSD